MNQVLTTTCSRSKWKSIATVEVILIAPVAGAFYSLIYLSACVRRFCVRTVFHQTAAILRFYQWLHNPHSTIDPHAVFGIETTEGKEFCLLFQELLQDDCSALISDSARLIDILHTYRIFLITTLRLMKNYVLYYFRIKM